MSSEATKHTFFVYAPDKTDEGALARRLSVRGEHLERAKTLYSSGFVKRAGALLTPESITGGERKMAGSTFIVEGESMEAVRKILESDVYYTSDVWDPAGLIVLPYLEAPLAA